MEALKEIYYFLLAIIPIGTVIRIVFCYAAHSAGEDGGQYKKRAKNAGIFCIIGMTAYVIIGVFLGYFGKNFVF